jgi:hypothetical protein
MANKTKRSFKHRARNKSARHKAKHKAHAKRMIKQHAS